MHTGRSPYSWGNHRGSRRGRGGESEKCLHDSQFIYSQETQWWGFLTSQTPDTPSVWPGLTSETSKNYGYSIHSWEIYTQNLDMWLQVHEKTGRSGSAAKGVSCAWFLSWPIIKNTITKTSFLLHSAITGHSEPCQDTLGRCVFVFFMKYLIR